MIIWMHISLRFLFDLPGETHVIMIRFYLSKNIIRALLEIYVHFTSDYLHLARPLRKLDARCCASSSIQTYK
jgi:hypothetical protein